MIDLWKDPIWEMMNLFDARPSTDKKIENVGLKSIPRPHNLVNIKNDDGKVVAQELRVVTTPFSKDDVKVKVCNNMLSVTCGSENIKVKDNEEYIFKGISSQTYSFTLSLTPAVDQQKITAENKDGVLKINLPLIVEDETNSKEIDIKID